MFYLCLPPGDVPLHLNIREMSDRGKPVVVSSPDSSEVSALFCSALFYAVLLCSLLFLVATFINALVCVCVCWLSRRRHTGRWRLLWSRDYRKSTLDWQLQQEVSMWTVDTHADTPGHLHTWHTWTYAHIEQKRTLSSIQSTTSNSTHFVLILQYYWINVSHLVVWILYF